ncbi:hypothetical protein CDO25_31230 (plasmid) [Sinorhizobium meliloti]|nr:hypothetical protein CDO25_31230 [Sinorhizobium meliloti]
MGIDRIIAEAAGPCSMSGSPPRPDFVRRSLIVPNSLFLPTSDVLSLLNDGGQPIQFSQSDGG